MTYSRIRGPTTGRGLTSRRVRGYVVAVVGAVDVVAARAGEDLALLGLRVQTDRLHGALVEEGGEAERAEQRDEDQEHPLAPDCSAPARV